jgi:tetratricopeptide (TPR) repeat protein
MPNVTGAEDHRRNERMYSGETRNARATKFHEFTSLEFSAQEMNEKHSARCACSSVASSCKRARNPTHSRPLLEQAPAALLIALGAFGCAAPRSTTAEPHSAAKFSSSAKPPLEVPRTVITPELTTDIPELWKQAFELGEGHHYEAAGRGYDRVFELDPDGTGACGALFKAAEMYDYGGLQEEALARYEQVARRFPNCDADSNARIRALRLLTYLEHYERAGELAELTAAKYRDLQGTSKIAVLSARALSRLAVGDDVQAEYFVSKARDIIERENLDAAGRLPQELAPVYFALGEVRRLRAERIHFVPVPENFGAALEQRCQLLLDAQSAYSDAMRAYDAHWSAMAGFRVGELYQRLHEELMQVPAPKAADTERRRQLFEGAMRLRYSILLDKAKTMMDHTVTMADRTGEQSPWVLKARQARDAIAQATQSEREALARLPYTREQLQAALDSFATGRTP